MPSRRSHSPFRFIGSCCVTLACWTVWLGLGASLAVLIYIANSRELAVPDFLLRRVEASLAKADLSIRFGRARFDPTGTVVLEDIQLRARQFEDPFLVCRLALLRRDFWSILSGRPIPDEIRLDGATLQLPAMLSPSGTAEPLLRDVTLVLRHSGRRWQVDQCAGHVGTLTVTAHGALEEPAHVPGAARLSPAEITGRILQTSRRLALALHQIDAFERPALSLELEIPEEGGNLARVLVSAQSASQPWGQPVTVGPVSAAVAVPLGGLALRPVRLLAAARSVAFREDAAIERVRAEVTADFQPQSFLIQPRKALVVASEVKAAGESVLGPVLQAEIGGWPRVRLAAALQAGGDFLSVVGETRIDERTARVTAEGRAAAGLINRVLAAHTPRAAPYFVFGDPVDFEAEAEFSAGWHFERLACRVDAGRIDSRGVKIAAARGRIDIAGTSFLAHEARLLTDASAARGTYWMDFATTDYRMLLEGRMRPHEIDGWFRGGWWHDFWESHFRFPGPPPEAEVDVQGRWREPLRTLYFGRSEARSARVWGGDFEAVHAMVFFRPNFTHAWDLDGQRGGGAQRLTGALQRRAGPGERESPRLEFDFDSSLAPETITAILPGLGGVLADFQFTQPPQVQVRGLIEGEGAGAASDYAFTGRAAGGLRFFGFPLETAQVDGRVSGGRIALDQIEFAAAGGRGAGHASLDMDSVPHRLGFDLNLTGAEFERAVRAAQEFEAYRTGEKAGSPSGERLLKRAIGGRIDVSLAAQGRPGELATFAGNGKAALTGAALGEVHLFGLLSEVLSKLSLNFSSLKLDAARTSFKLENGWLQFPDFRVTGPSALIEARGNYVFATSALDFTAKFKPYEGTSNLLKQALSLVINPITNILELKLSGPLRDPNWSVIVAPSVHPGTPAPPAGVPAADEPPAPEIVPPAN